MIKINYFTRPIGLMLGGFLGFAPVACLSSRSTSGEAEKKHWVLETKAFQIEKSAPDASSRLVHLKPEEISVHVQNDGIAWQPFLLAEETKVQLEEKDFLLTLKHQGRLEGIPKAGECFVFEKGDAKTKKRLVTVTSETSKKDHTNGMLVFGFAAGDERPSVVGVFDSSGKLTCELPESIEVLSTGFGETRVDKAIKPTETTVTLKPGNRGLLVVQGGRNGLKEGNLVRLARIPLTLAGDDLESLILSPFRRTVPNDLFHPTTSPRENVETREYLATSILVTGNEMSLPLEASNYTAVIIGSSPTEICLSKFEIKNDETTTLRCNATPTFAPPIGLNRRSMNFDATFLPTRLTSKATFRKWLDGRGTSVFLSEREDLDKTGADQNSKLLPFVLVPVSEKYFQEFAPTSSYGPLLADFSAEAGVQNFAVQAMRAVSTTPRFTEVTKQEGLLHGLSPTQTVIGGTSNEAITAGAPLFSSFTRVTLSPPYELDLSKNDISASNGSMIEWIEPSIQNAQAVRLPPQQRFRGRVLIPPYNRTEFLELHVNGKLHKRLVISKPNDDAMFEFIFDEKIESPNDFTLSLLAWGHAFLPEFLYGRTGIRPIALTRVICVDVNENNKCDASDIAQQTETK